MLILSLIFPFPTSLCIPEGKKQNFNVTDFFCIKPQSSFTKLPSAILDTSRVNGGTKVYFSKKLTQKLNCPLTSSRRVNATEWLSLWQQWSWGRIQRCHQLPKQAGALGGSCRLGAQKPTARLGVEPGARCQHCSQAEKLPQGTRQKLLRAQHVILPGEPWEPENSPKTNTKWGRLHHGPGRGLFGRWGNWRPISRGGVSCPWRQNPEATGPEGEELDSGFGVNVGTGTQSCLQWLSGCFLWQLPRGFSFRSQKKFLHQTSVFHKDREN